MSETPHPETVIQAGVEAIAEMAEIVRALRADIAEKVPHEKSLHSIAEFFASVGAPDVAEHIARIALALYDRAHGVHDPILDRPEEEKNKRDASQVWRGRTQVTLGFECLCKTMSQPDAVKHIERHYPGVNRLTRWREGNLATSLPRWHLAFTTKVAKPPPDVHLSSFRFLYKLHGLNSLPKEEYAGLANSFLSKAVEIAETIPG